MEYTFKKEFNCVNESDTLSLGSSLATYLPSGSVVILCGDLGSGKTTLVKGVALGLNINEKVLSPTFNIMKLYLKGNRPLVHIDAYRLEDATSNIGLDEFIGIENGLTFIEWPQFISNFYDEKDVIKITFNRLDEGRRIIIESNKITFEGFNND